MIDQVIYFLYFSLLFFCLTSTTAHKISSVQVLTSCGNNCQTRRFLHISVISGDMEGIKDKNEQSILNSFYL